MATGSELYAGIEHALASVTDGSVDSAIAALEVDLQGVQQKLRRLRMLQVLLAADEVKSPVPPTDPKPSPVTTTCSDPWTALEAESKQCQAHMKDHPEIQPKIPGGRNAFMQTNLRDEEKVAGLRVPVTLPAQRRAASVTRAVPVPVEPPKQEEEPVQGRAMQGLKSRLWHFIDRSGPSKASSIMAFFPEYSQAAIMQALQEGNAFVFDRTRIQWNLKCKAEEAARAKENE